MMDNTHIHKPGCFLVTVIWPFHLNLSLSPVNKVSHCTGNQLTVQTLQSTYMHTYIYTVYIYVYIKHQEHALDHQHDIMHCPEKIQFVWWLSLCFLFSSESSGRSYGRINLTHSSTQASTVTSLKKRTAAQLYFLLFYLYFVVDR